MQNKLEVINPSNNQTFAPLQRALLLKYAGKFPEHVIVLGYNVESIKYKTIRAQYPSRVLVVYQLEQLGAKDTLWYNPKHVLAMVRARTVHIESWLQGANVIWEYSHENLPKLRELGVIHKTILRPIEYSPALVYPSGWDVCFFGSINQRRLDLLAAVAQNFSLCAIGVASLLPEAEIKAAGVEMLPPKHGLDLWGYIARSKVVLNLHYYPIQEQVRLSELIANNVPVLSEASAWNYFSDLIEEFEGEAEMLAKLERMVYHFKPPSIPIAERFKLGKYKQFKVGAVFNSFYDVDILGEAAKAIRSVVEHIVVVHQNFSFLGETAEPTSMAILNGLLEEGIINELIIYEPMGQGIESAQVGVLAKRNIGLEACRAQKCNYIMPMDADEHYVAEELLAELQTMFANGEDTLYSPIWAYYADRQHYFIDTYYVPSVYKIDDRTFKFSKGSLLVDPVRKMDERKFRLALMSMHHYTYQRGRFEKKLKSKLCVVKARAMAETIKTCLAGWQEGQPAIVFGNNKIDGNLELRSVELLKRSK